MFQTFGGLDYMPKDKWHKIVIRLWILWISTLFAVSITLRIYSSYLYVMAGVNSNSITRGHFLFSVALAGFYFYPLLFIIKAYSIRAKMNKSVKAAWCLIAFLSAWLTFSIIAIAINLLT